jgi:hypothetical protein
MEIIASGTSTSLDPLALSFLASVIYQNAQWCNINILPYN